MVSQTTTAFVQSTDNQNLMNHHMEHKTFENMPIKAKQYLKEQLIKSSRHIETNDNIFSNNEPDRNERLFNPHTISRQPIVTHIQNSNKRGNLPVECLYEGSLYFLYMLWIFGIFVC